jgi:two-component system, cell cycle response regulator DivK
MKTDPIRPLVILAVEDNEANRMLIQAVLESRGYGVILASSATEALASIARQRPDLILMDVQLPGQDGLALTRPLKADPDLASIPVVAITAHAMASDRQLCLEAGCIGYIAKPFNTRTLGAEIQTFLQPASQT